MDSSLHAQLGTVQGQMSSATLEIRSHEHAEVSSETVASRSHDRNDEAAAFSETLSARAKESYSAPEMQAAPDHSGVQFATTVIMTLDVGFVCEAGLLSYLEMAKDQEFVQKTLYALQKAFQAAVVKAVNSDNGLKASATLHALRVIGKSRASWPTISENQVRVDIVHLQKELKRPTSASIFARVRRGLQMLGKKRKDSDPSVFIQFDLSITGNDDLARVVTEELKYSDVRIAIDKFLSVEYKQLMSQPEEISNIKIMGICSMNLFHDNATVEMVMELSRADRSADDPSTPEKSGDRQLEMILRTDAQKLDAVRDAIAEMAREVGCIRDRTARQLTWRSFTCGCVNETQIDRNFAEENVGKEVTFQNGQILDVSMVEIETDTIAVSKESIWGYPVAILVDFTVTLPIEPFILHRDIPTERLAVLKRKRKIVQTLNKYLTKFQLNQRTQRSTPGEVYQESDDVSNQEVEDKNLLKVDRLLHRGIREERCVELQVDDDVFFDFVGSLKRHLRTSQPDRTIGRRDLWDDMCRLLRFMWSLVVTGSVFMFTLLIFMDLSSSGLIGFEMTESDPFQISIPVYPNLTTAQRIAGRDNDGRDIADICQGFTTSLADVFLDDSTLTRGEAMRKVLEEVNVSSIERMRELAMEGSLHDKQGSKIAVSNSQRESLKWGGSMGFHTSVDRTFPSQHVVQWLAYSWNWHQTSGSKRVVRGFETARPSAILEVNGFHATRNEDDRLDPERLEELILTFLISRCFLAKSSQPDSLSWAQESPSRREMWATLGIFPRVCSESSRSGSSAGEVCKVLQTSEENCKSVGCCVWKGPEKGCDVQDDINQDTICTGQGVAEMLHSCKNDTPAQEQGSCNSYSASWLAETFSRILYSWECVKDKDEIWVERRVARRWWDELSDEHKEAAEGLGYDQELWDSPHAIERSHYISDIRLTLTVDNYLEQGVQLGGVSGLSVVQMMCTVVMEEIQNFLLATLFVWHNFDIEHPKDRLKLFLVIAMSFCYYLIVPMCVVCASWMLIAESASIFDVIVDTVALLFLLDINSILLIYKSGGSGGSIMISQSCGKQLSWTRNQFHRFMCWLTLFAVPVIHFGVFSSFSFQHPSILLNPLIDRGFLCPKAYLPQERCPLGDSRLTYAIVCLLVLSVFILGSFLFILTKAGSATKTLESINGKRFGGGAHKVKSKENKEIGTESSGENPDDKVTVQALDQKLALFERRQRKGPLALSIQAIHMQVNNELSKQQAALEHRLQHMLAQDRAAEKQEEVKRYLGWHLRDLEDKVWALEKENARLRWLNPIRWGDDDKSSPAPDDSRINRIRAPPWTRLEEEQVQFVPDGIDYSSNEQGNGVDVGHEHDMAGA